jgi:hypothetical protein
MANVNLLNSLLQLQLDTFHYCRIKRCYFYYHLPGIRTSIKIDQCLRGSLQTAFNNMIFSLNPTLLKPGR